MNLKCFNFASAMEIHSSTHKLEGVCLFVMNVEYVYRILCDQIKLETRQFPLNSEKMSHSLREI